MRNQTHCQMWRAAGRHHGLRGCPGKSRTPRLRPRSAGLPRMQTDRNRFTGRRRAAWCRASRSVP